MRLQFKWQKQTLALSGISRSPARSCKICSRLWPHKAASVRGPERGRHVWPRWNVVVGMRGHIRGVQLQVFQFYSTLLRFWLRVIIIYRDASIFSYFIVCIHVHHYYCHDLIILLNKLTKYWMLICFLSEICWLVLNCCCHIFTKIGIWYAKTSIWT